MNARQMTGLEHTRAEGRNLRHEKAIDDAAALNYLVGLVLVHLLADGGLNLD